MLISHKDLLFDLYYKNEPRLNVRFIYFKYSFSNNFCKSLLIKLSIFYSCF